MHQVSAVFLVFLAAEAVVVLLFHLLLKPEVARDGSRGRFSSHTMLAFSGGRVRFYLLQKDARHSTVSVRENEMRPAVEQAQSRIDNGEKTRPLLVLQSNKRCTHFGNDNNEMNRLPWEPPVIHSFVSKEKRKRSRKNLSMLHAHARADMRSAAL